MTQLITTFTIEDLEKHVQDCYLDYAASGTLDDLTLEWELAHHPTPACKGGTKTVKLLKKHHAIHGVIQSEVFQYPCIFGWEANYLDGELYDLCKKWHSEKSRMSGGSDTPGHRELWEAFGQLKSSARGSFKDTKKASKAGKIGGKNSAEKRKRKVEVTFLSTGETFVFESVRSAMKSCSISSAVLYRICEKQTNYKHLKARFL